MAAEPPSTTQQLQKLFQNIRNLKDREEIYDMTITTLTCLIEITEQLFPNDKTIIYAIKEMLLKYIDPNEIEGAIRYVTEDLSEKLSMMSQKLSEILCEDKSSEDQLRTTLHTTLRMKRISDMMRMICTMCMPSEFVGYEEHIGNNA